MICKCKVKSNYGKKGEVIDLQGVKELTDRQKALLEPHETKAPKVVKAQTK